MENKKINAFQDATGATSMMRVGFCFCLIICTFAAGAQILGPFIGISADNTGLIGVILGIAFTGKAVQAFAERGQ